MSAMCSRRTRCFPGAPSADNIGYGAASRRRAGAPSASSGSPQAIHQAGLDGFARFYPSALSGGMRQRAALMRTLVVEPQILLMDEPFGALDTHTKIDMHAVLLRIWEREQQTVLFVTHDLGEALTLGRPHHPVLGAARPDQGDFEVDFPRPRDAVKVRETPRYAELFRTSGTRSAKNSSRAAAHEARASGNTLLGRSRSASPCCRSGNGARTCTPGCRGWCRICSIPISCPSRPRSSSSS